MQFADNTGLIRAFIACLHNQCIRKYMSVNRECPDQSEHAHLNLRCSHMA